MNRKKHKKILIILSSVLAALLLAAAVFIGIPVIRTLYYFEHRTDSIETHTSSGSELTAGSDTKKEEPGSEPSGTSVTEVPTKQTATVPDSTLPSKQSETKTTSGADSTASSKTTTAPATRPDSTASTKTTTAPATRPGTTAPTKPSTTVPTTRKADPPPETTRKSAPNEYDIYRSGTFYVKGQMTDSEGTLTPMELAVTPSSTYILTSIDDISLGVLLTNGKTYLLVPKENACLELSSTIMSMLGMSPEDLSPGKDVSFTDMKPLSEAESVTDTQRGGVNCREYRINGGEGNTTYIYMNGSRLVEMIVRDANGTETNRMIFDFVTADIPADKKSAEPYDKIGIIKFMSLMGEDIK